MELPPGKKKIGAPQIERKSNLDSFRDRLGEIFERYKDPEERTAAIFMVFGYLAKYIISAYATDYQIKELYRRIKETGVMLLRDREKFISGTLDIFKSVFGLENDKKEK